MRTQFFADKDNDLVFDWQDNCPEAPNEPLSGICIYNNFLRGQLCYTDADCDECDGGYCSKNQEDQDGDGLGSPCDNCYNMYNPDQKDKDNDSVGNVCDNCILWANPDQSDFNNDGIGDACDLNDGYMGPNEEGADCGGDLGEEDCPSDYIPLILFGDSEDKIDITFVPTQEYSGNIPAFRADAFNAILNSYYVEPTIWERRSAINFWYTKMLSNFNIEHDPTYGIDNCDWDNSVFFV